MNSQKKEEQWLPLAGLRLRSGEVTAGRRPNRTLRQRNARIARAFDLTGKRVLDLGCAEGLHSLYMAESAREVVGIDHRISVIGRANANKDVLGISNVTFMCADIRDPTLWSQIGNFDLIVAWGFLHRITDVFSLLQTLGPVAEALSLEWRTPIFPLMSRISLAYHSPAGDALDQMNIRPIHDSSSQEPLAASVPQEGKIEGDTGFWEPTPGAVRMMCRRVGFKHARLLGYGEGLHSEAREMVRNWGYHLLKVVSGGTTHQIPVARVHMIFEKSPGWINMKDPYSQEVHLPAWDQAIEQA